MPSATIGDLSDVPRPSLNAQTTLTNSILLVKWALMKEIPQGHKRLSFAASLILFMLVSISLGNAQTDSSKKIPLHPEFPMQDETPLQPVELTEGKITIIVPKGYEILAQHDLEDVQRCMTNIPKFLHMEPLFDGLIWKTYQSSKGFHGGFYIPGTGSYYARTPDIDMFFNALKNNPNWDRNDETFCWNAHEFTHYVVDGRPIPSWANEGLADFTQDTFWGFSVFTFSDTSWVGPDFHGKTTEMPFADLSQNASMDPTSPQFQAWWYRTGNCFWRGLEKKFGSGTIEKTLTMLGKLRYWNNGTQTANKECTKIFINDVLMKAVADKAAMAQYLRIFGFSAGKDY
jgi:hypothetical protein